MGEPVFVKFVRAVEGRAVALFGSGSDQRANALIGATRSGKSIEWDAERVVPLTEGYYREFRKEVDRQIKHGDLVEATEEEWRAWLELEEEREIERALLAEEEAKAAAADAEERKANEGQQES